MPFKDREKKRKYQREWKRKRRQEYMAGKICEWCGKKYELELHHIEPETKITSNVWSWSKERREAELAKCMILCETCHDAIHAAFEAADAEKPDLIGWAV